MDDDDYRLVDSAPAVADYLEYVGGRADPA